MNTLKTPMPEEALGDYIKRLRGELKMSQNQLVHCGVNKMTIK
jgi:hypothetical protein